MVYWSHINLFDVSVQRPRTECLCCCLHRHPLPKEDGHNVSNAQKQAKEKHNVTFPLWLIELRDSSSFRASVYSQHMATVVQHMAAAVFFQTWMENAEYSVKRPHLLPCEVKHQCFFFGGVFSPLLLKIICTTISDARGSIFISLPTTCADVNVTGDCWKLSPFIKWCKTAGEKRREGITEYFLNCSSEFASSSAEFKR